MIAFLEVKKQALFIVLFPLYGFHKRFSMVWPKKRGTRYNIGPDWAPVSLEETGSDFFLYHPEAPQLKSPEWKKKK